MARKPNYYTIPNVKSENELVAIEFGCLLKQLGFRMDNIDKDKRDLLKQLITDANLDAEEITKALADSMTLGFVQWGASREIISRLLQDPGPADIYHLVANAEFILKPLQDWVVMERNLNELRKGSITKYEYYDVEYRCSQIQNFILILKLY